MAVIKSGFEIVKRAMLKELMKRGDDGIMLTLPKNELVDLNARITMDRLIKAGIDPESLTSPDQVLNVLENINNQMVKNARVISADSAEGKTITDKLFGKKGEVVDMTGKKMDTSQGIMGGKSVKELMESGQVQKGTDDIKISEKITDRDMFKNSNLNKRDSVTDTITYIKSLKPMDAMKEANSVIGRKGKYKNLTPEESKKILQDTENHIFERDIPDEDFAKGGRAGHYTGGMVDVEPSLSDIGHGSDSLMARTRLVSPGNQATTSTGLNYLLAEDNDNIRVPFGSGGSYDYGSMQHKINSVNAAYKRYKKSGGKKLSFDQFAPIWAAENFAEGGRIGFSAGGGGRRAFLKLLASIGGGVAAAKSGILGLGKGGGKQITKEVAKEVATGSGTVPPYFLNLVSKIKKMGDETLATKDKANAYKYKDYTMEEDFAGNIEITKKGIMDEPDTPEVFMSLKVDEVPLKNKKGSTKVKDYEEFTGKRDYKGDLDVEPGVPDEVVQEGTVFEDTLSEFGKADGGRIGYNIGGLSKLGINSTSRKFLEKVFGKERFATMIENDPRMHRGMLEVVEMFRNKDKEGLKMYLQKFLPHMDDAEIENFIIGSDGTEGISGQLIRLGSGREYKSLMDLSKQADNVRKLDKLDVTEEMIRKPNSDGGRIGLFLGGGLTAGKGLTREMLKFLSKNSADARSPAELLKLYNPKQFGKLLNNPKNMGKISPATGETADQMILDLMNKMKNDRSDMVGGLIESAKKIKKVDDDIIAYKKKIIKDMIEGGIDEDTAYAFAERMGKEMKNSAAPLLESPPKITEQGLLELENLQKNLLTKDRKLQATGGLTTMLGE